LRGRRDGENVVIEVSDDGIGIAGDALSTFSSCSPRPKSLEQGRRARARVVVAKAIDRAATASTVSVASEGEGRGAKITVRFQSCSLEHGICCLRGPVRGQQRDRPQRVLLVDDNEDALDLLSALWNALAIKSVAHDGPGALAVLDRFRPSGRVS